jgi:2-methylcitrate dehydratase PrpD
VKALSVVRKIHRTFSEDIAEFVCSAAQRPVSQRAIEIACTAFVDTIGVMFAGSREADAQIVRSTFGVRVERGAHIIPALDQCPPAQTALINATAAHSLDYDDVALDGHPSGVLVPAIMAMAEDVGSSGQDAIDAYLVGYQVWGDLHERKTARLHDLGWHPTCIFGAISAAASCALIGSLNEEQTQNALGIAASLTSGLLGNFGSMTKPLQVGRAAEAGVIAAQLARKGFTSTKTVFDRAPGFFDAYFRDWKRASPEIGGRWLIEDVGLNIKRYPICYCAQRAVDGALALVRDHQFDLQDVDSIVVQLGETQDKILQFRQVGSIAQAKFCLEFCVAASIVKRRLGFAEIAMPVAAEPDVAALMAKVTRDIVPSQPGDVFAAFDRVCIKTKDGRELDCGPIAYAKGNFKNPLNRQELFEKFADCLQAEGASAPARKLFDMCAALHEIPHVSALMDAIRDLGLPPPDEASAAID